MMKRNTLVRDTARRVAIALGRSAASRTDGTVASRRALDSLGVGDWRPCREIGLHVARHPSRSGPRLFQVRRRVRHAPRFQSLLLALRFYGPGEGRKVQVGSPGKVPNWCALPDEGTF
jgi:hypothetical protein